MESPDYKFRKTVSTSRLNFPSIDGRERSSPEPFIRSVRQTKPSVDNNLKRLMTAYKSVDLSRGPKPSAGFFAKGSLDNFQELSIAPNNELFKSQGSRPPSVSFKSARRTMSTGGFSPDRMLNSFDNRSEQNKIKSIEEGTETLDKLEKELQAAFVDKQKWIEAIKEIKPKIFNAKLKTHSVVINSVKLSVAASDHSTKKDAKNYSRPIIVKIGEKERADVLATDEELQKYVNMNDQVITQIPIEQRKIEDLREQIMTLKIKLSKTIKEKDKAKDEATLSAKVAEQLNFKISRMIRANSVFNSRVEDSTQRAHK